MGTGWHWYIALITLINIFACVWLITWSSKQGDASKGSNDTLEHVWDGDLCERNNPLPKWWLYLFVGSIVFALGYLIYYPGLGAFEGTAGWSQASQYEAERARIDAIYQERFDSFAQLDFAALQADESAMGTASRLYASNCSTCHGSDARGALGFPNLTDAEWLYGNDESTLIQSITNGRQGVMPPWGPVLGDDGTVEVVEYVKSMSGTPHDATLAGKGKARYDTICIACHGIDGKGMQVLGAPGLTDSIWLYGGDDEALTISIAEGRMGVMPAHRDLLTAGEIRLLAAFVASRAKQN